MGTPALARLAGFFAAHAVWSVSEGETLVPILALEGADGQRRMVRLAMERLEDAVAQGQRALASPEPGVARAVLVFDGFITLSDGKCDALIAEARGEGGSFTMAVPYRPASRGFAVHRPKLLAFEPAHADPSALGEAFYAGVDAHTEAAKVWLASLDESR